jgi:hypothetical protein
MTRFVPNVVTLKNRYGLGHDIGDLGILGKKQQPHSTSVSMKDSGERRCKRRGACANQRVRAMTSNTVPVRTRHWYLVPSTVRIRSTNCYTSACQYGGHGRLGLHRKSQQFLQSPECFSTTGTGGAAACARPKL